WRTTRAWCSSRSRMRCTVAGCARASTPRPVSRLPSCSSRNARRVTWRSRGRAPKRCRPSATCANSFRPSNGTSARRTARRRGRGAPVHVIVSPGDAAEIRRVSVTNFGTRVRDIELTSYAEVVLAPPAADAAHSAFSNLSVETECVAELDTLLVRRRPRSRGDAPPWLAHVVVVDGQLVGNLAWETD